MWFQILDSLPALTLCRLRIVSFSVNPYLLALVEWRNAMNEEAAALVHASKVFFRVCAHVLHCIYRC